MRLARLKAEKGSATPQTLNEIYRLCALSEFNLARALHDVETQTESRAIATSLLTSPTTTQPTS